MPMRKAGGRTSHKHKDIGGPTTGQPMTPPQGGQQLTPQQIQQMQARRAQMQGAGGGGMQPGMGMPGGGMPGGNPPTGGTAGPMAKKGGRARHAEGGRAGRPHMEAGEGSGEGRAEQSRQVHYGERGGRGRA
jgi:hypothetical protein